MNKILIQVQAVASAPQAQKFEVVVGVVAVIFVGILAYLIRIDRNLKKLEDKQ